MDQNRTNAHGRHEHHVSNHLFFQRAVLHRRAAILHNDRSSCKFLNIGQGFAEDFDPDVGIG